MCEIAHNESDVQIYLVKIDAAKAVIFNMYEFIVIVSLILEGQP